MTSLAKTFQFTPVQERIQDGCNVNFDDVISYINARNAGTAAWDAVYTQYIDFVPKTSAPTAVQGRIYFNSTDLQWYGSKDGATWSIVA